MRYIIAVPGASQYRAELARVSDARRSAQRTVTRPPDVRIRTGAMSMVEFALARARSNANIRQWGDGCRPGDPTWPTAHHSGLDPYCSVMLQQ